MSDFYPITQLEGIQLVYQNILGKIDLANHPKFYNEPVRILDIGGGTGHIGHLLKQQCESQVGQLSNKEFTSLVDYVNVDKDVQALEQSVGTVIEADTLYLHEYVQGPFDYILSVHTAHDVDHYDEQDLGWIENEGIRENMAHTGEMLKIQLERIDLVNIALMLKGKYIGVGFMMQDVIQGIMDMSKEYFLGLKMDSQEHLSVKRDVIETFAAFDTGETKGSLFEEIKSYYHQNYMMFVLSTDGAARPKELINLRQAEIDDYRKIQSYVMTQDRFWM